MDNGKYLKNVMKTLSQKPAKLGLKTIAKSTARTNVFHAITGLAAETMELVHGLHTVIIGEETFAGHRVNAFEQMGDIGYFMAVARKFLKIKMPASTKKIKNKGMTRALALMQMHGIASQMLDLVKKNFYGPKMKEVEKLTKPKVGEPVLKKVMVVDVEATDAMYAERQAKLADLLDKFSWYYYALCWDMFEKTPAEVYDGNIAKLVARFPAGTFDLAAREDNDPEAEVAAMSAAVPA